MVPDFANPHALSRDVEVTTRSEIAERAGFPSIVHDIHSRALERDLDSILRDTWADVLAETSSPSSVKNHLQTADFSGVHEDDGQLAFRLVSSMKCPQPISLDPRPSRVPPPFVSEGPQCEDDDIQAETRKTRSMRVTTELMRLGEPIVSTWQENVKPVAIEAKVPVNTPLARPLPPLLLTEQVRRRTIRVSNSRAGENGVASPHEPRPRLSCAVLPVLSVPDGRKMPAKKRPRSAKERPPPAYWRPSRELRGKCMGYALGYPSSWAPDRLYVRDTMKKGS